MLRTRFTPLILVVAALALPGCRTQYSNYPAIPTSVGHSENPNSPSMEEAMVVCLQFVANRYAPGGPRLNATSAKEAGKLAVDSPMAIHLPAGTRRSFYLRAAKEVGPQVVPLTPQVWEAQQPPIYHVTRVWLRGIDGQVDIMRPMSELAPGKDGKAVYQTVTLWLKGGGIDPWHVVAARAWEPGIDPVPEPYFVPDVERFNQFEYTNKPAEPAPEHKYWEPAPSPETPAPASSAPAVDIPPADTDPAAGPSVQPTEPK